MQKLSSISHDIKYQECRVLAIVATLVDSFNNGYRIKNNASISIPNLSNFMFLVSSLPYNPCLWMYLYCSITLDQRSVKLNMIVPNSTRLYGLDCVVRLLWCKLRQSYFQQHWIRDTFFQFSILLLKCSQIHLWATKCHFFLGFEAWCVSMSLKCRWSQCATKKFPLLLINYLIFHACPQNNHHLHGSGVCSHTYITTYLFCAYF